MTKYLFLLMVAPIALLAPAIASAAGPVELGESAHAVQGPDIVTTGVAKGRDRLDSATSTSTLREAEIEKLGATSIGDLLRDVPGIRSEASKGEGNVNLSIRGLPIASSGAKFVQLQEDGLPVLEFGDILGMGGDNLLRADLNLAQVEVIRGGSASTFASNSPGGIINFLSKTGEVEGGAVAVTTGLDYEQYRTDFDYGGRLGDGMRFHVGGFYRQGEGPRRAGYDAQKGGQIKANVTKEFTGGYIRLYGKYLDDRTPYYDAVPFRADGSNDDPKIRPLSGFDGRRNSLLTRNLRAIPVLDGNNNLAVHDIADGQRSKVASIGVEAKAELAGWTVIERFRYADISGTLTGPFNNAFLPAPVVAQLLGGPGATLSYANGADRGQAIAAPSALNGNGALAVGTLIDLRINDNDNVTNDIRASRVWKLGDGDLTTTAGFYAARQSINYDLLWATVVSELRGGGEAALVNIVDGAGRTLSQDGFYSFNLALSPTTGRPTTRLDYAVNAPFASVNYHIGRIAVGGSIRYDYGSVEGRTSGLSLAGGGAGITARDMNGDGVISIAEQKVGFTPLSSFTPVDYDYDYLSYSAGINFRIAEPVSVFARYSRGARANADRILFSAVDPANGSLRNPDAAFDPVRQAEAGVKYRHADMTLNLTGFWARARDTNFDTATGVLIGRDYKAVGVEFEGGYRRGIFVLTGGATYTDAHIDRDRVNPALEGKTPRHQARLIFQATPQVATERFGAGAALIGTTGSFAQDDNVLKMPGYVTTNAFVQARPAQTLQLTLNAANLFNTLAITGIDAAAVPATGIAPARVLNGRTVSLTARYNF